MGSVIRRISLLLFGRGIVRRKGLRWLICPVPILGRRPRCRSRHRKLGLQLEYLRFQSR